MSQQTPDAVLSTSPLGTRVSFSNQLFLGRLIKTVEVCGLDTVKIVFGVNGVFFQQIQKILSLRTRLDVRVVFGTLRFELDEARVTGVRMLPVEWANPVLLAEVTFAAPSLFDSRWVSETPE